MIAERAISAGVCDPPQGLAFDEALVRAPVGVPTLLVWRTRPAVVIGRFQRADWEVDAAACAHRGVRVWRRFTGGGAVYLDPGTVCAAIALPASHPAASAPIPQLYAPLLDGMVRACRALGADAARDDRTVRIGDRKVTGIAAHRGRNVTLVHGTLLVGADLDSLRACLAGPRGGDLQGRPRPAAEPSRPRRARRRRRRLGDAGRHRGARGAGGRGLRSDPGRARSGRRARSGPATSTRPGTAVRGTM